MAFEIKLFRYKENVLTYNAKNKKDEQRSCKLEGSGSLKLRNIKTKNKKSQITIFVILGLIIVVLIALFFVLRKPPEIEVIDENNPQAYIESCTREAVEEAISILSRHGGDINPKGSIAYQGEERIYLCYTEDVYDPCVNQRPMLIEHIEKEITNYIWPRVENCFQKLESRLEKRYDIKMEDMQLVTKLQSKHVSVEIGRYFKMTRGEKIREFENFKMNLIHPIYDLAEISMEIANQEAHYCNFDEVGYMIVYPKYDILKFITGDSDIIYTIKDRTTEQEFVFAVRSCKLPPGY